MAEISVSEAFRIAVDHQQAGRPAEAVPIYRQILQALPAEAGDMAFNVLNNLGAALDEQGQLEAARACFTQALQLQPSSFLATNNLAHTFRRQSRFDEAIEGYRRALALNPQDAGAHFNLSVCLQQCGHYQEALSELQQVEQLAPGRAQVQANLGYLWSQLRRFEHSAAASRRAIELDPRLGAAYCNLGLVEQSLGQLDEAIGNFRRAVELSPGEAAWHGNLLYALNFHPGYDAETISAEHRAWAARHADPLTAQAAPHSNDRSPERRLRVGYVSPYFRSHAVNAFAEPLLAAHDHAACEVFCYSDVAAALRDEATERLKGSADHWRETVHLPDAAVSALVREDQIDILVDLSGHIGENRLLAFARRPAPVQVTYLGYQNTTGMQAMDYRLTDAWSDKPGTTDRFYTEELVRLPRAFFCYQPADDAPPVGPLPAESNEYVTFGSFNNYAKVTPEVLDTWAELLARIPQARLVLLAPTSEPLAERAYAAFAKRGVQPERVEVASRRPYLDYLRLIQRVDIALDTFPFNGHTTTCDALWMGVPVVMLAGSAYASRFGGSALVNLGLDEWIAHNRQQYLDIAQRCAGDLQRLAGLRARMRERMTDSPLLDAPGFARHVETAYRRMWRTWCSHNP
ncbi:MAG: tetratricopeptide repeat protein [Planctomycetota bacterium]|nr:MAG: tetratricopeptide repeat protein [Planctomycetota bacterium]